MARDLIQTLHRTMGAHLLMFVSHEAGEGQVKMAVFETAPDNGKKPFTASSEVSKDWILNGETILMDYLLTAPVEEDSAEKQENLARAVLQAAYVHEEAQGQGSLGVADKVEYLDSESIPEGFTMKDPSKWTKADLGLLWDHWQSLEAEEKKWVEQGYQGPQSQGPQLWGPLGRSAMDTGEVPGEATTDVGEQTPEESSPAWHASKDQIQYLKSLSIMPRYQVLLDLVDALPEEESAMDLECQCFKVQGSVPPQGVWRWFWDLGFC
ncbi:hypothetical protein EDD16DRAFT_1715729 [Pisolithus croceorrhizus]|nr:hypothetical protein EDD16DRAFT_1715729 [Pisolithus croceorrhizus]KAI6115784.1 hypothetical protein EV401DRAFT_2096952 [Pisolithus croceorrhizus]KAI6162344.1 hypothetical protein EDD17DRAFT_1757752 [Pisolithus thermaeus]